MAAVTLFATQTLSAESQKHLALAMHVSEERNSEQDPKTEVASVAGAHSMHIVVLAGQ
jgi:hypothetical protein